MAKIHLEVMAKTFAKLKRDIEESVMREQLIKPLTDLNFRAQKYPRFALKSADNSGMAEIAGTVSSLISSGVIQPNEAWIRQSLRIPQSCERG